MVTNTVSTTCPITTAPAIAVTLACPATPAATGGLITYTGTVRNSGNVTLNNVIVVNNQSAPSTVLTVPSLAPGASANFTASFTAPADACSVSSTVTASGSDTCTQAVVNNSASATCPLVTTPRIVVTQICPANPATLGGLLTYSGTVSNAGNITLTNVVVTNDLSGATPVFTAATLAPGEVASFTGSYLAPTKLLDHEHLDRHRPERLRRRRHPHGERDLSHPDGAADSGHGGLSDHPDRARQRVHL